MSIEKIFDLYKQLNSEDSLVFHKSGSGHLKNANGKTLVSWDDFEEASTVLEKILENKKQIKIASRMSNSVALLELPCLFDDFYNQMEYKIASERREKIVQSYLDHLEIRQINDIILLVSAFQKELYRMISVSEWLAEEDVIKKSLLYKVQRMLNDMVRRNNTIDFWAQLHTK